MAKKIEARKLSKEDKELVLQQWYALQREGKTMLQAANAIGITYMTLHKWEKQMGKAWRKQLGFEPKSRPQLPQSYADQAKPESAAPAAADSEKEPVAPAPVAPAKGNDDHFLCGKRRRPEPEPTEAQPVVPPAREEGKVIPFKRSQITVRTPNGFVINCTDVETVKALIS